RELEEQRKRAKYPKTRVRIRFADRTQVETTFASSSRIPAVYAFTKSILSEEASSKAFVLCKFATPPRREFKASDPKIKDKSLYDLQLIPTAVLFIKFEDDTLNDGKKEPPIKPALLELAEELPRPPSFDPTPADLAALARTQEADAAKGEKKSEGVKAPKWLTAMKSTSPHPHSVLIADNTGRKMICRMYLKCYCCQAVSVTCTFISQ
ncbi:hypothetical protein BT69DRAFT_1234079, partial [Atractiella rhizophila]